MGIWDVYCPLCGMTFYGTDYFTKTNKWIDKTKILLCDNTSNPEITKKFHGYEDIRTMNYKKSKDNIYMDNGIVVHMDCYKLIEKERGISLKFSDFVQFPYMYPQQPKTFNQIDILEFSYIMFYVKKYYGDIMKYQEQFYNFIQEREDGYEYFEHSPLKSDDLALKNRKRILSLFDHLEIKKGRQGPSISATLYPENTILIGNNGNFWQKNKGKWNEIKEIEKDKFTIEIENKKGQYDFFNKRMERCNNYDILWYLHKIKHKNILSKKLDRLSTTIVKLPRKGNYSRDGIYIDKIEIKKWGQKEKYIISLINTIQNNKKYNAIKNMINNINSN